MATTAIGDLHGHLRALDDLSTKLLPTLSKNDFLVFLGDWIDKGPDVRGCVDRIIALREQAPCPVIALLANHEQYMLRTWKDSTFHSWIWIGGFETIESYLAEAASFIRAEFEARGPRMLSETVRIHYEAFFDLLPAAHLEFFTGLRSYCETDDVICVHAGVDPAGTPMHLQDPEVLVWGTECFPRGYRGQPPVVYDHWDNSTEDPAGRPLPRIFGNRTFGIDAIFKGVLTAMRFPGGEIFQSGKRSNG